LADGFSSVQPRSRGFPNRRAGRLAGAKYPELVAAQWFLESSAGKLVSGRNNFFGLKGEGSLSTTQEFINGCWITIRDSSSISNLRSTYFPTGSSQRKSLLNY
jgi:hypothetical protein